MRGRAFFAATLALCACGEAAPNPETLEAPETDVTELIGPLDDLARRFGRLRRRMETRGYGTPTHALRTFVLEGEGEALPVDLPTGACATWVALGGGGLRDLDLRLFDGDGNEVAADAVRGEGGLVHVCPAATPEPGTAPYYVELRAVEGSGAVVVGAFASAAGEGEGFAELFEGLLAPPVPFVQVEAALGEVRDALRERGMTLEGEPAFQRLVEGRSWRVPLAMDEGRCYVVVARGGEGVTDVDLYLYGARGAEVARDLGQDAAPRVEHCVQRATSATVEVQLFEGQGAVGLLVASGPPPTDEAEPVVADEAIESDVSLEDALSELEARGFGEVTRVVEDMPILPGESRTHALTLGPGCVVVAGAGGPGELDLDLYLADASGTVDRDTRVHRRAWVAACPPVPTAYRVTVKAYGRGRYALARAAGEGFSELAELRIALALEDQDVLGERRPFVIGPERPARLTVPDPRCVRAVVGASAGVQDVDLLLRRGGELVASDTGPAPWARLAHCPGESVEAGAVAPLTLEIVSYRGEGPVVLRWLEGL